MKIQVFSSKSKLLILVVAGLIIVLLLALAYFYYDHEVKKVSNERYKELKAISELKISQISEWRKERLGDIKILASRPNFIHLAEKLVVDAGNTLLKKELAAFLAQYAENYAYENLFIVSADSELLYSFDPEFKELDKSIMEPVDNIIKFRNNIQADLFFCRKDNKIHYDLLAPVFNKQNKFVAILILRINPDDYLYPLIREWPTTSRSSETFIVRKDGDSVLFLSALKDVKDAAMSFRLPLTRKDVSAVKAVMGYKGIFEGKDYLGIRVIADIRPVPGTNWFMIAKIDSAEVFSEVRRSIGTVLLLVIILLTGVGFGIALYYNKRQRDIYEKLLEAGVTITELQEFKTILYSIGDAVITTDTDGRVRNMNPVAERLTGWKEDDARGKPVEEVFVVIAEETRARIESPVQRVLREGVVTGLANHSLLVSRQGKEIPVADSGAPVLGEKNKIYGVVLVFRDQTAQRQAEQKLKQQALELTIRSKINKVFLTVSDEEMYSGVLNIILEAMMSKYGVFGYIDKKGGLVVPTQTRTVWDKCQVPDKKFVFPRETWGNSSWPRAIREKKTICINTPSDLIPQGQVPITRHISMPLVRRNTVVGLIQVANKETDYTPKDIALFEEIGRSIAPVLDARLKREKQEIARRLAEENLRQTNIELERSNKELEQFAYVASHDLQEPLRMISSFTQLLSKRYTGKLDKDANEFIGYVVDGANRMQRLIQDLLSYSRVTTRGNPFEEVDTYRALGEAISNLQVSIKEMGAVITNDDLPEVTADYTQIVQLFQNLIGNAVKFHGPESPRIHFSAVSKNSEWIFSVRDNGIGIASEYLERIFVIFQRLHPGNKYPGTGIGLAICSRIVQRHGGKIWAESEPGKGSVFYFTLKHKESNHGINDQTN
jgi:PAS domain S-box-containing protein